MPSHFAFGTEFSRSEADEQFTPCTSQGPADDVSHFAHKRVCHMLSVPLDRRRQYAPIAAPMSMNMWRGGSDAPDAVSVRRSCRQSRWLARKFIAALEARGSGLSHSAKCILPPIFLLGLSRLLAGCGGVSVFETWFVTITDLLKPAEPPPP